MKFAFKENIPVKISPTQNMNGYICKYNCKDTPGPKAFQKVKLKLKPNTLSVTLIILYKQCCAVKTILVSL